MADKKLFDREIPATISSIASTMRIAIGTPTEEAKNLPLSGLKIWLGLTGTTPTALLSKTVDIGSWNMDGTPSKSVSTGVALSKIRGADVIIKSDSGEMFPLVYPHSNEEFSGWWKICNSPTSNALIVLSRKADYFFDCSAFDSTTINRGFITISYVS